MSRDSQRYRKTYSYYRVQPKTELLEVIVDETLDWKHSVRAASTASVSLAGSTPLTIDDVTLADEDRVLLKDQGSGAENGIYYCEISNGSYTLTRASDARQDTISCGATTYVEEGTANSGKIFIMSTTGPITVGTTAMSWVLFSGAGGGVGGSGTTNYVSKFTASGSVGNSSIYDNSAGIGIGTTSFSGRFFVSGSDSAIPTAVIKGGYASLFDVQNFSGTSILFATGTLGTVGGRVGIGTSQPDAKFQVSSSYGGSAHGISIGKPNFLGLASNAYTSLQHNFYGGDGTTQRMMIDSAGNTILGGEFGGLIANTARLFVSGSSTSTRQGIVYKSGVASPTGPLLDIRDYLGNSIIFVSGSGLSGSLTKLTDGTSYLIAGSNITINTGSNGAVQITGSGPSGSGTDGYLARWSGSSTTLGDSFIKDLTPNGLAQYARYYKDYHQFRGNSDLGTWVEINSNGTTGGRIGIGATPEVAFHIIEGLNGAVNTVVRLHNNNSSNNAGIGVNFRANGNTAMSGDGFKIEHSYESGNHITRFKMPNVAVQDYFTLGPVEEVLRLSANRNVLVTGSFTAKYDTSSGVKTIFDLQKSNGDQVLWVSSSAGSNPIGTDVFMWVSGSRSVDNTGTNKVVFGGDVRISGSLSIGTGSVLVTSNDIQFETSGTRIQKSGNDIKFFDLNNTGGKTLTELAAAGGGSASPEYWASPTSGVIYATGSVGIGTTSVSERLSIHNGGQDRVGFGISSAVSTVYLGSTISTEGYRTIEFDRSTGSLHFKSGSVGSAMLSMATFDQYGRLGIGTTSPTAKLHVVSANDELRIENSSTAQFAQGKLRLKGPASTEASTVLGHGNANAGGTNTYFAIEQHDSSDNFVRTLAYYSHASQFWRFSTNSSVAMTIDSSQSVGIGVSILTARLHVQGSTTTNTPTLLVKETQQMATATAALEVQDYLGNSLLFVSGSGNVGIGTTSPGARFHVYSGATDEVARFESTGNPYISLYDTGVRQGYFSSNASSVDLVAENSKPLYLQGATEIRFRTNTSTERMIIDSSGDVGIGITNPNARLDILSSNGTKGVMVRQGATAPASATPILQVKGYDDETVLWVSGSSTHGARVGIGTTNPRSICMLDVGSKGSTGTNNYVNVDAFSTGECGYSWSAGGANPLWKFSRAASTSNISLIEQGSSNVALLCEYSTGYVGIGTNDPSEKLHVTSGSIKVDTAGYGVRLSSSPTNADAQTLDAYYEATIQPVALRNNDGDLTMASGFNSLKMTRIGRLVTLTGHLKINEGVKPTGVGRLKINMSSASIVPPLAANKTAASIWITSFFNTLSYPVQAYMDTSDSLIYVDAFNAGAAVDLSTYLDTNAEVVVSVTYVAA